MSATSHLNGVRGYALSMQETAYNYKCMHIFFVRRCCSSYNFLPGTQKRRRLRPPSTNRPPLAFSRSQQRFCKLPTASLIGGKGGETTNIKGDCAFQELRTFVRHQSPSRCSWVCTEHARNRIQLQTHAHLFCATMLQLVQLFARNSQKASLTAALDK